ncbi:sulfur carrier protein ThiS [Acetobacter sicerae]|uniref:Sulfur carrier protein ThiS n=1 Tax=Acetobacter sicerae TaxID=85325 RepID=A0ABS8VRS1_9PROT|nr:sulfur carrier protein ThiS [Acetobacter sicerae]MCE0742623.1 sulfur carrier protein ThiS [Acetobacter sicerae]NHN90830.1 sulfur carrier protein ThiS [Acetobacter sicerae]
MNILVNDEAREVTAATLAALVDELGLKGARIATAVDGDFVPASRRSHLTIAEGMKIEIVAPMQGG